MWSLMNPEYGVDHQPTAPSGAVRVTDAGRRLLMS
jgi:hypothetical protein